MTTARPPRAASAFTLIEAVISVAIVGIMLAAAMNTLGASHLGTLKAADGHRGELLAHELMAEIFPQAYEESPGGGTLGPDGSESETGDRSLFDDVDDYDGWSASPPQDRDGAVKPNLAGWARSVTVTWVQPLQPDVTQATESGAKEIVVSVMHDGVPAALLRAVRADVEPGP